jgi:hypothetical protein
MAAFAVFMIGAVPCAAQIGTGSITGVVLASIFVGSN